MTSRTKLLEAALREIETAEKEEGLWAADVARLALAAVNDAQGPTMTRDDWAKLVQKAMIGKSGPGSFYGAADAILSALAAADDAQERISPLEEAARICTGIALSLAESDPMRRNLLACARSIRGAGAAEAKEQEPVVYVDTQNLQDCLAGKTIRGLAISPRVYAAAGIDDTTGMTPLYDHPSSDAQDAALPAVTFRTILESCEKLKERAQACLDLTAGAEPIPTMHGLGPWMKALHLLAKHTLAEMEGIERIAALRATSTGAKNDRD